MIQLRVGRSYFVRNPQMVQEEQKIIKIVKRVNYPLYGFDFLGDDGYEYKANGRFRKDEINSDYDLVEEVKQ